MKKDNKKFIIVLAILIILLIVILSIILLNIPKNKLNTVVLGKKEEIVNKSITFTVYKYNSNSGSLFIKFRDDDNGINNIEMPEGNIIYANGRKIVSADYDFKLGDTIEVSMTTMTGEEITQRLTIDKAYIDDLLSMVNLTPDETEYQVITVNTNIDKNIASNKYYKLGDNNNTWVQFKEKFVIHDYDVVRKNLINTDDTVTVYIKSEDNAENAIVISDKVAINRNATLTATPIVDVEGLEKINSTPSGSYILVSDIDLSGKNYANAVINSTFTGTLDGNGHKITNYTVNTGENAALIRCGRGCTVKNLKIENANITGSSAAGLIGLIEGSTVYINNCAVVKSTLYGTGWYGAGVAGLAVVIKQNTTLRLNNCYSYANTMNTAGAQNYTGGILHNLAQHYNYTYANQCYFSGNLGTSTSVRYMIGAQRVDLNLTSVYYDSTINTNATVTQGTALNTFGNMTQLPSGFDSDTWVLIDDNGDGKYDRPELKIFMPIDYLSRLKEKMELMIDDYREQRDIDGITLQEYLIENDVQYDIYDSNIEIEENGYIFKINSITLEMDEPVKITKKAKITLSKDVIEIGEELAVTFVFGKDIDVANCKYKLEKANVTVEKENVTTLIPGNKINNIQLNEKGDYYFYLLVAYKDGTESILKKVKLKAVIQPTVITLNETNLILSKGETYNLIANIEPSNAEQGVIWSTSDVDVVTVNNNGIVTAVSWGTAIITATSNEDISIKSECTIIVESLESISITTAPTKIEYNVGEKLNLTGMVVTATYTSGRNKNVTNLIMTDPDNDTVISTSGKKTITVSYTENNITKTATTIIVVPVALTPTSATGNCYNYSASHGVAGNSIDGRLSTVWLAPDNGGDIVFNFASTYTFTKARIYWGSYHNVESFRLNVPVIIYGTNVDNPSSSSWVKVWEGNVKCAPYDDTSSTSSTYYNDISFGNRNFKYIKINVGWSYQGIREAYFYGANN